jgi:hypothetical protein
MTSRPGAPLRTAEAPTLRLKIQSLPHLLCASPLTAIGLAK